MDTVRVETSNPAFDRYLDWLKYQTLSERIWARRGFYQASGAYGFRDQLQDAVNLMWMEPRLARRQTPPARLAAVCRRGRAALVPSACRTAAPASPPAPMPRITSSGFPGPSAEYVAATGD